MIRFLAGVIFGAVTLTGSVSMGANRPLRIVVSVLPQQEIVQTLGGSGVEATVLIPPGRSPATFEPSPRMMASVSEADLLMPLGLPFERTVISRIHDIEPDLPSCNTPSDPRPGVSTAEAIHHSAQQYLKHDHAKGQDPHFWLDPLQTIEYARQVCRCLCEIRPQACRQFTENLEEYTEALEATDRRIAARLAPFAGRTLLVFHPAFGHFARRYGLKQVAIETEGKNPTGRHLGQLIEDAENRKVKVIFVQPQFAGTGAQAVAVAVGADLVELDPLAPDLRANLERIAGHIAKAFEAEGESPQ